MLDALPGPCYNPRTMNTSDLLAHSSFFAALSSDERTWLGQQMIRRRHDKDDYLFFEGEPAEWLLFIAEGQVKMIKHSESGRETIVATFGTGQIVGEVGVLVGEVYPATAQALEPTATLSLRRDTYTALVRTHPELAWALIIELGHRLQRAHETIRSLAVEKVERRVARVLLRMAFASGERLAGGAVRISVPLSRQDIADMAGTVIETAIRTLSKFQKQGLIETIEGHVVLLQPHQLVAIADEL
jgi:CRP/FNR family transcriptional regulator, nitrogen oxide reductase regulator